MRQRDQQRDNETLSGPQPKSRVMTDKRREQNRQAQKKHRQRKKRQVQEVSNVEHQSMTSNPSHKSKSDDVLQDGSNPSLSRLYVPDNGSHDGDCPKGLLELQSTSHIIDPDIGADSQITHFSNYEIADENVPIELEHADISWDMPSFELESLQGPGYEEVNSFPVAQNVLSTDTVDFPQLSPGYQVRLRAADSAIDTAMAPRLSSPSMYNRPLDSNLPLRDPIIREVLDSSFASASTFHNPQLNEPSSADVNQLIAQSRISIEEIIFAGLESITHKASGIYNSTASTPFVPSPSLTHIPLRQMALMAACFANAAHLGVDIYQQLRRPSSHSLTPSPIYQADLANTTLSQTVITNLYRTTKPDLRPCAAQIKQPHSLYIDLFPFPSFRQRILSLNTCITHSEDSIDGSSEPIFNEDEFCKDLDAGGMVCWGSDADIGTGCPWDRRSWECRPWFLRKWWIVTGGVDGEIGRQSRWWAEIRGEAFEEM